MLKITTIWESLSKRYSGMLRQIQTDLCRERQEEAKPDKLRQTNTKTKDKKSSSFIKWQKFQMLKYVKRYQPVCLLSKDRSISFAYCWSHFPCFFMNTKKFSDQYKLFLILLRPQCMVTLKLLQLHFSCFFPVNLTKFPISNNLPAIRISISMTAAMFDRISIASIFN